MVPQTLSLVSVEAFESMGESFPRTELVGGQVVELTPPGMLHGVQVALFLKRLHEHVMGERLGLVVADSGFVLDTDPPTVRAPDIAVVLSGRIPSPLPRGFFRGAPDLAIEVLSPGDRPAEVAARIADYLRAGSQAVWVVDSEAKMLAAHTPQGAIRFGPDETLEVLPPLPVFRLALRELFEE